MRTYRELFGVREFRTLFGANCLTMAGGTLGGLALGTLTYQATGSPVLTALAMFGTPLVSVIGSLTLLSAADSMPPRRGMVWMATAGAVFAAVQMVPGLPLWLRFAALAAGALVRSVAGGARPALLTDLLPPDAYVFGRSTLNITVGVMQIVGYATGGLLLVWLAPEHLFGLGALSYVLAVVWLRFGLTERPARSIERTSLRQTMRVNRYLWSGAVRRSIFLSLWVPNGLVVGCEALFIPYAEGQAGYLLAAAALGMLAGDVVMGRFIPATRRDSLIRPLRWLLAGPYLLFFLSPPLFVAIALTTVASFGFAAALPLQNRLLDNSDGRVRGQVLGLHNNGLMTLQAVGAGLGGLVAEWLSPGQSVAVMALLSLVVAVALTPGLRRSDPVSAPSVDRAPRRPVRSPGRGAPGQP